ncbi:MAG TPA: histidine kinase [Pyrinomonadaceae bacterium]|nr:histidine kinase [Pyrinomonadaceae bacterium]
MNAKKAASPSRWMSKLTIGEPVDLRMICLMRLILASSALFIIFIDPSEPDRLVPITYAALIIYVLYSLALYLISVFKVGAIGSFRSWTTWMDVGWNVALIALSSGTNSIFFFFFFFAILVASFSWGFASGVRITLVSTALFIIVGYATSPAEPHFQLNRFLLRPVYLLVLGYMIAYWGGCEVKLRKRLKLLREISALSNPRFGIDHTITSIMETIRSFYEADSVLLLASEEPGVQSLRRVDRRQDNSRSAATVVNDDVAAVFLSLPDDEALIFRGRHSGTLTYELSSGQIAEDERPHEMLVNALESKPFLAIPIHYRARAIGRCFIIGGNSSYSSSDVDFMLQALDQVIPLIDNIRLVDRLASDAAEREREKIARDLHDSVIQPYIGLQLGLAAISRKVELGDTDALASIKELLDLTSKGISDLRDYTRGMKTADHTDNTLLVPALQRFAAKFSEATGIQVEVEADKIISINDRLAGEVFQMVSEGLSNVRRHSQSKSARAVLTQANGTLLLRIENENPDGPLKNPFHPKSLEERAAALGGEVTVETNRNMSTVVQIQIPL